MIDNNDNENDKQNDKSRYILYYAYQTKERHFFYKLFVTIFNKINECFVNFDYFIEQTQTMRIKLL